MEGKVAGGEVLRAIGTMSGTSLDGVDAAVIETDGVAIAGFGPSTYRAYTGAERQALRRALGQWPGGADVAEAAWIVEAAHAEVIARLGPADVVGFHGQTLTHDPDGGRTHQAGDGARLARRLGSMVAWDFRSADMDAGGQGAPLAPVYHAALARRMEAAAPLVFLNLGGVGNLTWIDPAAGDPFGPGAMLAFDTGPANAPLDDLMQARRGVPFDAGGALAATGQADAAALAAFAAHPFFAAPPPKSLDRDAFAALVAAADRLEDAAAAATLTQAVALSVGLALRHCPKPPVRVLVTGGGRRNPHLMGRLSAHLECPVEPVEAAGFDGDMIEAQAFGYMAVRSLRGLPLTAPGTTGVAAPLAGGRIAEG